MNRHGGLMMKRSDSSYQPLAVGNVIFDCVKRSRDVLLTNVPVAMSSMPDQQKFGYTLFTVGTVLIFIAVGAATWVVSNKLKP